MKTKGYFLFALIFCLVSLFSACQSKEKRNIDRLDRLATEVERNGEHYNQEQWEDAMERYEEIHEDMDKCRFSNEQLRELGRIDGRLMVIFTKEYCKMLGESMGDMVEGVSSFTQGLAEGIGDEDFDDELESLGNQLDDIFDD